MLQQAHDAQRRRTTIRRLSHCHAAISETRDAVDILFEGNCIETGALVDVLGDRMLRSEEHTSELQSLMRSSYAVFCLKKKKRKTIELKIDTNKHYTSEQTIQHYRN